MAEVRWMFVHGEPEGLIWLDVSKFDALWQRTEGYVGVAGQGSTYDNRYKNVGAFICKHRTLFYPVISLRRDNPIFTDGRHRTAWLRDHGAEAIPFICGDEDAALLSKLCGTQKRETQFREPGFALFRRL